MKDDFFLTIKWSYHYLNRESLTQKAYHNWNKDTEFANILKLIIDLFSYLTCYHLIAWTGKVKDGKRIMELMHILKLFHVPQKMSKNYTYWPKYF